MPQSGLAKRLRIAPGARVLVLNAPAGFLDLLDLPEGARVSARPGRDFDVVHLFAKDRAGLERRLDAAVKATKPGGVLWISYPKGGSGVPTDLNRDKLWDAIPGWRPVAQVAVDPTWSAMWFRPQEEVKSRRR